MVRVVVVGAGQIANSIHLPVVSQNPDCELAGVVDLSAQRAEAVARQFDTSAFTSLGDAIAGSAPDAVILCVPGEQAELTQQALEAGVHVLAEKPLAYQAGEAERLAELSERVNRVLWVGYMKMADPALSIAKTESQKLGSIRLIEIDVLHPADERQVGHIFVPAADDVSPEQLQPLLAQNSSAAAIAVGPDLAAFQSLYSDVLLGSVVHQFSVLRALGAVAPEDFAFADAWPWPSLETPPCITAWAEIDLPNESNARFGLKWMWVNDAPEYQESVRIVGTAGHIEVRLAVPYQLNAVSSVKVSRLDPSGEHVETEWQTNQGSYEAQLEMFLDAVRNSGSVLSDGRGAANDARAAWALMKAVADSRDAIGTQGSKL